MTFMNSWISYEVTTRVSSSINKVHISVYRCGYSKFRKLIMVSPFYGNLYGNLCACYFRIQDEICRFDVIGQAGTSCSGHRWLKSIVLVVFAEKYRETWYCQGSLHFIAELVMFLRILRLKFYLANANRPRVSAQCGLGLYYQIMYWFYGIHLTGWLREHMYIHNSQIDAYVL